MAGRVVVGVALAAILIAIALWPRPGRVPPTRGRLIVAVPVVVVAQVLFVVLAGPALPATVVAGMVGVRGYDWLKQHGYLPS